MPFGPEKTGGLLTVVDVVGWLATASRLGDGGVLWPPEDDAQTAAPTPAITTAATTARMGTADRRPP
jgi:hypothetical protein